MVRIHVGQPLFLASMLFRMSLLLFFPVSMGVADHQGEDDRNSNQQNNDDRPMLPDFRDETGEILIHA